MGQKQVEQGPLFLRNVLLVTVKEGSAIVSLNFESFFMHLLPPDSSSSSCSSSSSSSLSSSESSSDSESDSESFLDLDFEDWDFVDLDGIVRSAGGLEQERNELRQKINKIKPG